MDIGTTIAVIIAGAVGGFVNVLILGNLENPRRIPIVGSDGERQIVYNLGWIGSVIIGAAASFTFWTLEITSGAEPQVYGIAVLSGIAGSRLLVGLTQQQLARFERDTLADELAKQIDEEVKR